MHSPLQSEKQQLKKCTESKRYIDGWKYGLGKVYEARQLNWNAQCANVQHKLHKKIQTLDSYYEFSFLLIILNVPWPGGAAV